MASIREVANLSQVSSTTVSHVINNTRFVAEETRQRVLDAIEHLHYIPNSIARSLATGKGHTIGLIVPALTNPFFATVAEGVERHLQDNGYSLLLCNSKANLAVEKRQIMMMIASQIRGIIIAPTDSGFNYRSLFRDASYPLVFIDRRSEQLIADSVNVDNRNGTKKAIQLLFSKGHTRIGFITGRRGISTTEERLQGYLDAYEEANLEVSESWIQEEDPITNGGYDATKKLVETTEITAILSSNNLITIGTVEYLMERGIAIPGRIALIGFDDYRWANITNPPLTTIMQPASQLGIKAAECLLNRIHNPNEAYAEYTLHTDMVMRKSC